MSELIVIAKMRMLAKDMFAVGNQGTAKKLNDLIDELPRHSAESLESISDDTIIEYLVMKGYVVEKVIV